MSWDMLASLWDPAEASIPPAPIALAARITGIRRLEYKLQVCAPACALMCDFDQFHRRERRVFVPLKVWVSNPFAPYHHSRRLS